MNADTFFAGCRAHRVCEDYARSGCILQRPYIIVSDGCSSSPDTDMGARFLTLSAVRKLMQVPDTLRAEEIIVGAASSVCLPLSPQCLDATLLVAREVPTGVEVHVAGDGFVVARDVDKHLTIYEFDFRSAPAYLSYLLDPDRRKAYLQQGFGERTIRVWSLEAGPSPRPSLIGVHHDNPFTDKADYPTERVGPFWTRTFPKSRYDLVLVCTDGASAFQHKDTLEAVPFHEVIGRLIAFPNYAGEFVTRRVRHFVTKECAELGWVQNDDLGVGTIYFGESG